MAHPAKELEIEVAYLPREIPAWLTLGEPVRIVDVYLSSPNDLLSKLRLRQKGTTYEITKKVNTDLNDLSMQDEYTIPLSEQEFDALRKVGGREVDKDRYAVPYQNHILEIDVFREELEGLVIIEVEFASAAERDAFQAPPEFGPEVTQEDFIAGAYLAGKSFSDIAADIDRVRNE